MREIQTPLDETTVRSLRVGDEVFLSGVLVTARDVAHKFMVEKKPTFLRPLLRGSAIYHCGPVMKKERSTWKALSAGPTTSAREEPYTADVIQSYRVRAIVGKGGMGPRTLEACRRFGAVYLHAVGGAAVSLAQRVVHVRDVLKLDEFGMPEAFWVFEVEGFPTVVTMDASGASLHAEIAARSHMALERFLGRAIR
ncbi:MAG: fumarate hydratase C-terminal domain-containing protein [Deltaproteobacteria bacterium]|nr:fumarate hydratase C-terminal domain-containing protein [Deltaproteobacteria bacterium]